MTTEDLAAHIPHPPFRLANRGTRISTGRMRQFLRKCGITVAAYSDQFGDTLCQFAKDNPTWTQRAWEILVLENMSLALPQTSAESPDPAFERAEKGPPAVNLMDRARGAF